MIVIKKELLIFFIFTLFSCSAEISENNNSNNQKCPERIVSLTLASDEILLDLINDKRLIGVTYLAKNKDLSNVFDKSERVPNEVVPNTEHIITLKPDLIIVANFIDQDFIKQIEESGIQTLNLYDPTSIENIAKNIELIGRAVCEKPQARKMAQDLRNKVVSIKSQFGETKYKPTVLYMFPSGFTAGANTTVGEIIEISGGINLGKKAGLSGNKRLSTEYILEEDPDIIIVNSYNINEDNFVEKIKSDTVFKNLSAIKNDQIYVLKTKHLTTVSQHIVKGIEDLTEIVSKFNSK